jgi:Txe/YoeB family toxin of Txe-Axe toxin-antitoxin module
LAQQTQHRRFYLSDNFLENYKNKQPNWGPIGYVIFKDRYARKVDPNNPNSRTEEFWETLKRVVEGTFNTQKNHVLENKLTWDNSRAQKTAQLMYDAMWNFKFLPAGRGLWACGTDYINEKTAAPLFNCSFISTENIVDRGVEIYEFVIDALMLGVGIGIDTLGANKLKIKEPKKTNGLIFEIPDSREGWVESVGLVLNAYFNGGAVPKFDYSKLRPFGEPIKGFGGTSSGPKPLKILHNSIIKHLDKKIGDFLSSGDIVDLENYISKCVIAGNVRRSAALILGDPNDQEFITLKHDQKKLMSHRYGSNNSVSCTIGMDYEALAKETIKQGEPGFQWLENARKYGRVGEKISERNIGGTNPCGEIFLEGGSGGGGEMCVRGSTPLQLRNTVAPISNLINKEVEIWNGQEWAKVIPFKTSPEEELIRITFTDGSYLDVTKYHRFKIRPVNSKIFKTVKAEELKRGHELPNFNLGTIQGTHCAEAFEYGLIAGDGYIDGKSPNVCICGNKAKLQTLGVKGKWGKPRIIEGYTDPVNRLYLKNVVELDKAIALRKEDGLPSFVFEMDTKSILEFVAGYIETAGTLVKQANTDSYTIYGKEQKMRDLQLLLRRININHATVFKLQDKGTVTNFGKRNYSLWGCSIPSYECSNIPTRLKKAIRIGSTKQINNAHPTGEKISIIRKQKVRSIENINTKEAVYCFYEPKTGMGVFGNTLTYQCNLVETFPASHESLEEYKATLKLAYLYGKSMTLTKTHWPETNAIMLKNRRIGISQSGIIQAFNKHGRRKMLEWCDKSYDHLRELDKQFSDWLAIPRSIKMTTVKPSGTVSLLCGATPGIHYPESEFYIRRVRFAKDSPFIEPLKKANYTVEPDKYAEETTLVVDFPIHENYFEKSKKDVSVWEQLENTAKYQKYWADNAVSNTITFSKDKESNDISKALELYEDRLKSVSFLPLSEHGYAQAPYEGITKKQYEKMINKLKPLDFSDISSEAEGEKYCDGDNCQL